MAAATNANHVGNYDFVAGWVGRSVGRGDDDGGGDDHVAQIDLRQAHEVRQHVTPLPQRSQPVQIKLGILGGKTA